MMPWSGWTDEQTALRDRLARLAQVRREHAALRRGSRTVLGGNAEVLTYEMSAPGDSVVVALNRSDSPQPGVGIPAGDYEDLVTGAAVRAPLSVAPRTAMILTPR
jgi:hypothetical protein